MAETNVSLAAAGQNPFDHARAIYEMARDDALEPAETDAECELLGHAHSEATSALLLTPSPDLAALAYKLDVFAAEDCFGLSPHYRDPLFTVLVADARALNGGHEA